ncbi:MAG: hypothetical protein AB8G86_00255 [Saprospiraceae bacterium]
MLPSILATIAASFAAFNAEAAISPDWGVIKNQALLLKRVDTATLK